MLWTTMALFWPLMTGFVLWLLVVVVIWSLLYASAETRETTPLYKIDHDRP